MQKMTSILLLMALACSVALSGCSWVGRTAGKAQAKIERKVNDVESGYNEGYDGEKSKTSSQKEPASTPLKAGE